MGRVKTFANLGFLLVGDLNAIQDDYEQTFDQWRTLRRWRGEISGNVVGGSTEVFPFAGGVLTPGATSVAEGWEHISDLDLQALPRARSMRLALSLHSNAVAAAVTFEVNFAQASFLTSVSGGEPRASSWSYRTSWTAIGGIANAVTYATTPEFSALSTSPTSHPFFAPRFRWTGTTAVGSRTRLTAVLQARQV